MNRADVVVVGGGPAGSAAAIGAARAGLDAVLLDAGGSGGPGETLHPGVGVLLADLGVDTGGLRRHRGHWVQWAGPPRFEPFGADGDGPWLGYQAPRASLDPLLVAAAERAGARVRRDCRARDPIVDGGRVVGVGTDRGDIRARVTVDASGRRHWMARRLGLPIRRVSAPLVVAYGHTAGPPPLAEPLLRGEAHGWTWIAPVTASITAWVRLRLRRDGPGWRREPGDRGCWARVPEELTGTTALAPTRGADVTWRHTDAAGPGWLLVGDAAAVLDPASSHGVLRALMSGLLAAHAVAGCAAGRVTEQQAATGFRRWSLDWFRHDVTRLDRLYRGVPGWPRSGPPGVAAARSDQRGQARCTYS